MAERQSERKTRNWLVPPGTQVCNALPCTLIGQLVGDWLAKYYSLPSR